MPSPGERALGFGCEGGGGGRRERPKVRRFARPDARRTHARRTSARSGRNMATVDFAELLGPALGAAISAKGFTELTPVQKAVLDPALAGRDLRVTSQTGSGKTVAIGLVIRELAGQPINAKDKLAHPRALVI